MEVQWLVLCYLQLLLMSVQSMLMLRILKQLLLEQRTGVLAAACCLHHE